MRLLFLCWTAALFSQAFAIDISGHWNGTVSVPLGEDLQADYFFSQNGIQLEGFLELRSTNGKDSSRTKIIGSVKGNQIHFRNTEIIWKNGPFCASLSDLVYTLQNDEEHLDGEWHGNWETKTCPPGTKGKINLVKLKEKGKMPLPETTDQEDTITYDVEGKALYAELNKRRYFGLIIGINQYEDSGIQDLDNPVNDANSIKQVLESNYNFPSSQLTYLQNPTRSQIIEAFDMLAKELTEEDHLLVFFAGHGIWDKQLNQGYWLPSDASKTSKAQWLSNSTIRDYIGGIRSKHTLVISDACFSGGIFKERAITIESGKAMLQMYNLTSRKAMTSGALSTVPDESVFVKYLIKTLQNNTKQLLSAEELFRSFKIAVINNSPNGQVPQYGPIGQVGDEGGDFIFVR